MRVNDFDIVKQKLEKTIKWCDRISWGCGGLLIGILFVTLTSTCAEAHDNSYFTTHPTYFYLQGGYGSNDSYQNETHEWNNNNSDGCSIEVGIEHQIVPDWDLWVGGRYMHVSQCFTGIPFDDESESSLDHWGITVTKRWRLFN